MVKLISLLSAAVMSISSISSAGINKSESNTQKIPVIKAAPGNMLNITVTDKYGILLTDNTTVIMKNSEGKDILSWKTSEETIDMHDDTSKITKAGYFTVSFDEFISVLPENAQLSNVKKGYQIFSDKNVPCNDEVINTYDVYYFDNSHPVEYTAKANTLVTNVDPRWADRVNVGAFKINGTMYTFNDNIGIAEYDLKAGVYDDSWLYYGSGGSRTSIQISDEPTEYIKTRIKISELSSKFSDDGTVMKNDNQLSFITDDKSNGAIIIIVSGCMVNAVMPDSEGYIEFYVDKKTNYAEWMTTYKWDNTSGGGTYQTILIEDKMQVTLEGPDYPDDGMTLMYVPKGDYTFELSNVSNLYRNTTDYSLEISDLLDVQNLNIVLECAKQLGDVNEDGYIDARDATEILKLYTQISFNKHILTDDERYKGDLNEDFYVDARDASLVLQYYAGVQSGKLENKTIEEFLELINHTA